MFDAKKLKAVSVTWSAWPGVAVNTFPEAEKGAEMCWLRAFGAGVVVLCAVLLKLTLAVGLTCILAS